MKHTPGKDASAIEKNRGSNKTCISLNVYLLTQAFMCWMQEEAVIKLGTIKLNSLCLVKNMWLFQWIFKLTLERSTRSHLGFKSYKLKKHRTSNTLVLSERSHTQKATCCMISFMWSSRKSKATVTESRWVVAGRGGECLPRGCGERRGDGNVVCQGSAIYRL